MGARKKHPSEVMDQEHCQALLSAGIPLAKLRNKHLHDFLEKYTGKKTPPTDVHLRTKYICTGLLRRGAGQHKGGAEGGFPLGGSRLCQGCFQMLSNL